ncbi:hypothetical protein E2C01_018179 [Portunus trituberculatus]|uniref:Uncharacterized protein n=1 Tax=Portunus trituberculatus TaxID=210409 RepID=A0A5B7DUD2_PORTR|nr:hypothetical protein [Portunus trituberculatus]
MSAHLRVMQNEESRPQFRMAISEKVCLSVQHWNPDALIRTRPELPEDCGVPPEHRLTESPQVHAAYPDQIHLLHQPPCVTKAKLRVALTTSVAMRSSAPRWNASLPRAQCRALASSCSVSPAEFM